jgi:predicted Fe-Mo cluster-binding NifX family protein
LALATGLFWAYAQNMKSVGRRIRVAVAEKPVESTPAARLGRALRFALFDVQDRRVRGPFYRVRHDEPGGSCGDHGELTALLHDCQVVIAGAAGERMVERLRERGIDVVIAKEDRPSAKLAAAYATGNSTTIAP